MKKIYIGILAFMMTLGSSCSDMLNTVPKDSISSATFWQSKNDVKLALAGCYGKLKASSYLSMLKPYLDNMTDIGYGWQTSHSSFSEIKTGLLNPSTGGVVSNIYNGMYKGVTACYLFLENFEKNKSSLGYTEEEANQIIAEVRFLKGYFLFELVQRFGGVVIYDKVPTVAESIVPQKTQEESLAYIMKDLDFAIENLPDGMFKGHVVKNTAKGLKARVAAFMGDWATVKTLTADIIKSETAGKVGLSETYDPIFIKRLGQESCKEIMFTVEYKAPDAKAFYGIEIEGFYWSGLTPEAAFISKHEVNDLRVKEWYYKAKNGSYLRPTDNTYFTPRNTTQTGYGCVKFFDKTNPAKYVLNPNDIITEDNVVLMRYAEILLMYAEAAAELDGGSTSDPLAMDAINRIRMRAQLPEYDGSVTLDQVRQERMVELAFEGFRWFDIVRWNIADKVLNGFESAAGTCVFEPHFKLWPFPQSEIDVNTELVQNPGY